MDKRGQMALGEVILLCIILLGAIGFVLWRETGKHTESNRFETGSQQESTTINHYSVIDFIPLNIRGCERIPPIKKPMPVFNKEVK